MRPSVYVVLCLLSASSSEATLISRTANRIHHAAIKRSARLAKDIRSALSNVLIEQPIIGPDAGNRVYCVANPGGGVQDPSLSTPIQSGGNGVIVSSITLGSSRRPGPTSTSGGGPVPTLTSDWKLVETREGASFFDGWDFWSLPGVFVCSFVGNHPLIPVYRPYQRYACSLYRPLHQLNLNGNAHRNRRLPHPGRCGRFYLLTHAGDRRINNLLPIVANQRTNRCKF